MDVEKQHVHDFWNRSACGEELYLRGTDAAAYREQAQQRYELEPYIQPFAGFDAVSGRRVLEIGVGLGADHERFAAAGADLYGIDLTSRAVEHTKHRLATAGLTSRLDVGDAEALAFPSDFFDRVYSWGVLHHSPDTRRAVMEVWRVLKPGGDARIMVYHTWSLVGLMLWVRYALLRLRPFTSLKTIYARYLESPGTKAYTTGEARELFSAFSSVSVSVELTHGDLLIGGVGQRHRGPLRQLAQRIWPRRLLQRFFPNLGLFLLITARK